MTLSTIERALKAGDLASAVEEARALWEASRAAALGDLLDRLSARAPGVAADWSRPLAKLSLAELPSYLDELAPKRKTAEACERIERLGELRPDPRVAAALTRLLLVPPFTARSSRKLWRTVLDQLGGQHADPRTLAALAPVVPDYAKIFGRTEMGTEMQERVQRLVAALRERFEGQPDDADARVLVERLDADAAAAPRAAAPVSGEELLAAVYADPDSDGPRLVYADWLLEQGDPRGELITLQFRRHRGEALTPKEEKREAALIKKHASEWLGAIAPVLAKNRHVFRRGFLEESWMCPRAAASALALNHPAWATVREITMADSLGDDHGLEILLAPAMRRLRVLLNAPEDLTDAIVRAPEHELEVLGLGPLRGPGVYGRPPCARPWDTLYSAPGLPRLRELRFKLNYSPEQRSRWMEALLGLWQSPLGARLERVRISELFGPLLEAWASSLALQSLPLACRVEVELVGDGGRTLRLRRGASGRFERVGGAP